MPVPRNAHNPHEPNPVGLATLVIVHGDATPRVHDLGLCHPSEAFKLALHCQGGVVQGDVCSPPMGLAETGAAIERYTSTHERFGNRHALARLAPRGWEVAG